MISTRRFCLRLLSLVGAALSRVAPKRNPSGNAGPHISLKPSCYRFSPLDVNLSFALQISRRVIIGMAFDLDGANVCATGLGAPFDRFPDLDQSAPLIGRKLPHLPVVSTPPIHGPLRYSSVRADGSAADDLSMQGRCHCCRRGFRPFHNPCVRHDRPP